MKVYVVQTLQLLEEDKNEITDIDSISSILGIYIDYKKALVQSIWYNLTDFEYTEDSLKIEKLSNDVKTFIRSYLDEDEVVTIEDLKKRLELYTISKLIEIHRFLYNIQMNFRSKKVILVSDVFEKEIE
jgi:hypothetical protein